MKRFVVIVLATLFVGLVGGWASAQVFQQRPTAPVDPPDIVSGSDIGFRIEGRRGDVQVGSIVVRVDGKWLATAAPEAGAQHQANFKVTVR